MATNCQSNGHQPDRRGIFFDEGAMWFHPYTLPFLAIREHSAIVYPPHFVKFWSPDRHNFEVFITVKISLTNKKVRRKSTSHCSIKHSIALGKQAQDTTAAPRPHPPAAQFAPPPVRPCAHLAATRHLWQDGRG